MDDDIIKGCAVSIIIAVLAIVAFWEQIWNFIVSVFTAIGITAIRTFIFVVIGILIILLFQRVRSFFVQSAERIEEVREEFSETEKEWNKTSLAKNYPKIKNLEREVKESIESDRKTIDRKGLEKKEYEKILNGQGAPDGVKEKAKDKIKEIDRVIKKLRDQIKKHTGNLYKIHLSIVEIEGYKADFLEGKMEAGKYNELTRRIDDEIIDIEGNLEEYRVINEHGFDEEDRLNLDDIDKFDLNQGPKLWDKLDDDKLDGDKLDGDELDDDR